MTIESYDAFTPPDGPAWLALGEEERTAYPTAIIFKHADG